MNVLQEAITLNNMGVTLYEGKGSNRKTSSTIGIPVFQRAVDVLRVFSEDISQRSLAAVNWPHGTTKRSSFCFLQHHQEDGQDSRLGIFSRNEYYLYNRPLRIPIVESFSSMKELSSIILTASTSMIFNMALAWHQLGEATGHEIYKIKACQLYDAVSAILNSGSTASSNLDGSPDLSMEALKCLVLNNRAQLYYETCDYVNSERCVRTMRDLLVASDALELILDENEVDELRLNMVCLQPPTVAHAA